MEAEMMEPEATPHVKKDATAADAEFLDTVADTSVLHLHRSNLLRLQMEQMAEECTLNLDVQDANHVQWAPIAHEYMRHVAQLIENATKDGLELTPSKQAPFSYKSDRAAQKALSVSLPGPLETVLPTHFHNVSNPSGNANVLPTLPLVVLLPSAMFDPKDYLRHRYFDKRNLIVWHIAKMLSSQKRVGQVYWEYQQGDDRKPILMLVPPTASAAPESKKKRKTKKQKKGNEQVAMTTKKLRFRVQILFRMKSLDWMASPLRLLPNRCNLQQSGKDEGSNKASPTPYYNHAMLEDAHEFHSIGDIDDQQEYPHLAASLLLAKIWCLKRGLMRNHDGWTDEHIALIFTYLYRTKQANSRMAPPQALAAFFKLLAETNWLGENEKEEATTLLRKSPSSQTHHTTAASKRDVLVMPLSDENEDTSNMIAELYAAEHHASKKSKTKTTSDDEPRTLIGFYQSCQHYDLGPVFLDSELKFNYFGRLSPSFIRLVQSEANQSLACLHSSVVQKPFDCLLRTNARFWDRYDAYLKIPLTSIDFGRSSLWKKTDAGEYESISRGLVKVLRLALGDRIRSIRLLSTGNGDVTNKKCMDAAADSDSIVRRAISKKDPSSSKASLSSPTGDNTLVIGISVNPDTCYRLVDRGPPADDAESTSVFLGLWGKEKAELRRFKDGAIVHAVVWGSTGSDAADINDDENYTLFDNDDKMQASIVERIIRHILKLHFLRRKKNSAAQLPQFALRDMASVVDSVVSPDQAMHWNPTTAHRMAMKAFDALADFLRKHSQPTEPVPGTTDFKSRLNLPLAIDAVEPLAPALRYAELYPPLPHPLLGGKGPSSGVKRASGAVQFEPIKIQLRFGTSSKWPSDLRAIGAAKAAMLLQLVNGIEALKQSGLYSDGFEGQIVVTPSYADIGFMGYVFRVYIRADPELKLLQGLINPSNEALDHLRLLSRRHVVAATHHSMVHAVYTSQPSSSAVVRMAKKWLANHLISGMIPGELVELMVCHIYTQGSSSLGVPGTMNAGFLRFLSLLATHDWARDPLIVDPQGQLSEKERRQVSTEFEKTRGKEFRNGPAMYIVSTNDFVVEEGSAKTFSGGPNFGSACPELVVLKRSSALAERALTYLKNVLRGNPPSQSASWSSIFQETSASFRSYSALLRVDPDLIVDANSSSTASSLGVHTSDKDDMPQKVAKSSYTRSMQALWDGPKELRIKLYRNLMEQQEGRNSLLLEWTPVKQLVRKLRHELGDLALFFYNEFCPDVIAVLWRPTSPRPFSAMNSEFARPVLQHNWKTDTLVTRNIRDVIREAGQYTGNIVVDTKVFDWGPEPENAMVTSSRKRKKAAPDSREEEPPPSSSDSDTEAS